MDDLAGDSRWRFHCGLSWAAAEEAERGDKWKALPPLFDGEPRLDDLLGQPSSYFENGVMGELRWTRQHSGRKCVRLC